MSKRGRTSSVTGRQDDDGESSDVPLSEPNKKKRKMDPVSINYFFFQFSVKMPHFF